MTDDAWGAMTIDGEARGEPIDGQIAVGEVIRNRARRLRRTVPAVVLAPEQFSCWSTHDPNRIAAALMDTADPSVVAWQVSADSQSVKGATLYHTAGVTPSWASAPTVHFVAQIGRHLFYTED